MFNTILNGDNYFVSYKYVVKNNILYNQSLQVSKAMSECFGQKGRKIIFSKEKYPKISYILSLSNEKFLNFLYKLKIEISNYSLTKNMQINSTTTFRLKTICLNIENFENKIVITELKQ